MRPELLALAVAAGIGDVLGGLLAVGRPGASRQWIAHLSALAAGVMLGTCFLSLVPEVVETDPRGPLWVALGFLFVFIAENVFGHRAHMGEQGGHPEGAAHELVGALVSDEPLITRVASGIAFLGLSVHAFFDGVATVVSWQVSAVAGAATFFAIALHKMPEGLSVSAIMIAASERRWALPAATALAGLTIAGGAAALTIGASVSGGVLLGFATGTLLYVAGADLLPMVSRTGPATAPLTVALGLALVQGALLLAGAIGLE